MSSGLMKKLSIMKTASCAAPSRPPRALIERVCQVRADARLLSLPDAAFNRMGWSGKRFRVDRALFLDTETTGLSGGAGTVAFLVGLGYMDGGRFTVEQYMISDYGQEPLLLSRVADVMDKYESVITYNGKTFDMPLLRSRFTMARMTDRWREMDQLDLITPSRRLWRRRLGDLRLSNLENRVLGLPRDGDIPGADIPARFFEFVKTGDLSSMEDVLSHNRQDIVTLSTLLCVLAAAYGEPESVEERTDVFSLGRALERQGEIGQARRLYHIAALPKPVTDVSGLLSEGCAGLANQRLYHIYRRAGAYEKAERTLLTMLARRQLPAFAHLELAKLYEHRLGRLEDALVHTRRLRALPSPDFAAIEARESRICFKIKKRMDLEGNQNGIQSQT